LTSVDLQHFNTKNVTDMGFMFSGCAALTTIHSNTVWQCRESENMFAGCTKLKGAVAYDKNKVDAKMANPETGYFTAKPTTAKRNRRSAAHLPAASKRGARKHLPNGVSVVNGKKTVKP
jgi:bacterial surface protein 26-residue repeat protein (3 repeats) (fragment)